MNPREAQRRIHEAIRLGDEDRLTAAIMSVVDMHVKAEALVTSVKLRKIGCARALIREGCDPCLKDCGRTALFWAVAQDYAEMLEVLLDDLLLLLDDGICLPQPRRSVLHHLQLPAPLQHAQQGEQATTQQQSPEEFMDADGDVLENRALFPDSATYNNQSLDSPSEPSATGGFEGPAEKGKKPQQQRRSKEEKMRARAKRAINEALFEAASHGSSNCIDILVSSHADPNCYFYHDDEFLSWSTPLMAACFAPVYSHHRSSDSTPEKYMAAVETLVRHGADIGKENCFGDTPLHWAAVSSMCTVASLLLRHGADIDRQNSAGNTPLMRCLEENKPQAYEMSLLLVERGASLNMIDKDGWTALHYAVVKKNWASTVLLLERGASARTRLLGVDTPLDLAFNVDNKPLIRLLFKWNSRVSKTTVKTLLESRNMESLDILATVGVNGLQSTVAHWRVGARKVTTNLEELVERLLSPLKLKQWSRMVILDHVQHNPISNVQWLPLPSALKDYLLFSELFT